MKLWKIAAALCVSGVLCAQVQLGRNVQIGGSGGGGCATGGSLTPDGQIIYNAAGDCASSPNIFVPGPTTSQDPVGAANEIEIKNFVGTSTDDQFNFDLESAVSPGSNNSRFAPHLWQMNCTNSGRTGLGCQIELTVSDAGRTDPTTGGLNPLLINMGEYKSGAHPGFNAIEIDQSINPGIVTSASASGILYQGPINRSSTFNNVYGFIGHLDGGDVATGVERGIYLTTTAGGTIGANYCDFIASDSNDANLRESFGCGPTSINTFLGPMVFTNAAPGSGTDCLQIDSTGLVSNSGAPCGGGGGSGTVTSVGLSLPAMFSVSGTPVTTTGTLAATLSNQSANAVFAGPATGSPAAPTFRALVPADLPLATTGAFGAVKPDGTTVTISGGVISSAGSGLSGQTIGYLPKATSATTSTTSSALEDTGVSLVYHGTGTAHGITLPEGTAISAAAGSDILYADATAHCIQYSANGGSFACLNTGGGGSIVASAEVVAFSATPTFSTSFNVSRIVLTGNITSFTLGAGADGQDKKLCFAQDATGSRTVIPPANVHGFFTPGTLASKWNCQTFAYDTTDSIWLALGTGVINQ